jgi:hypothetical protein
MPPLGSNVPDTEGNQLLAEWIANEANALTSYEKWRGFHFGSDPLGAPDQNPDGDSHGNFQEYLFRTDPLDGIETFQPNVSVTDGQASIPLPALSGRKIIVEHSTNLTLWQTWNAAGNDGIPRNPAIPLTLTAPAGGLKEFYRFNVSEN